MSAITPCIWFDNQGEEAINYYASIFPNSSVKGITRNGDAGPGPKGTLLGGTVDLNGFKLSVLNGGPHYTITPAISLSINCKTQEEVDHYWDKLGTGGKYMQCGWLTDKFGVTWQVVPEILPQLLQDPDKGRSSRAIQAMMKMIKLDIQGLKDAADGK